MQYKLPPVNHSTHFSYNCVLSFGLYTSVHRKPHLIFIWTYIYIYIQLYNTHIKNSLYNFKLSFKSLFTCVVISHVNYDPMEYNMFTLTHEQNPQTNNTEAHSFRVQYSVISMYLITHTTCLQIHFFQNKIHYTY